ncbi:MAG: DUF411 domain-containing protein [Burkholderiales bacterium]|nr:DUF411 domain-containing protein [Burkholderiales bacterium]
MTTHRRHLLATLATLALPGTLAAVAGGQARAQAAAGPAALPASSGAAAPPAATASAPVVEVWKSPSCGCCKDWIAHLEANGFRTIAHDVGNTAMRERLGIALEYGSCHTARVAGYAVEGHVPAADLHRLLRGRPAAIGLAVPRMPVGSPGMDGPDYGGRRDPYDVLLLKRGGGHQVFASYR